MQDFATKLVEEDGNIIAHSVADVEPVLDDCKMRVDVGATGSGDLKHAARIPTILIEHYCNRMRITFDEWLRNPEHIKRMLRDPDLRAFRIWQGAV